MVQLQRLTGSGDHLLQHIKDENGTDGPRSVNTDTGTGSNAMTGARRLFHTPVIGAVATPRADLLAAAAAVAAKRDAMVFMFF